MFAPEFFSREELYICLALRSEIVNNPAIKREHRRQYTRYRRDLESGLAEVATARSLNVYVKSLAQMLIAFGGGLGLDRCIVPKLLSPKAAKQICVSTLELALGPL